ncbi:suppressor of fused domain protein [Fimbriiglobus ruber]|uniref:Suppressor of fused-like domain-containing protein n=1 Tax=Fimbriiglobus ruber TaxID=1908690 RepID=A0A225DKP1_9BACT|nr:suppressor of fused domain protein [Fimbriiglobus ruber]OWK38026.1 hypothetical protein FRUB_07146 [Fimbriiglobus ruber]
MDYKQFYSQLFAPLETEIGPIDPHTLFAIMGFDGGGPLNFDTIGAKQGRPFVTYVSCELAVRKEQRPSSVGRFELLCSCDDEQWVRSILSELGRMSLRSTFGHGHTIDIGPKVGPDAPIQGVWLEAEYCVPIDDQVFAIYRVIGITRPEMEYKRTHGSEALEDTLKAGGVYPNTAVNRASVV